MRRFEMHTNNSLTIIFKKTDLISQIYWATPTTCFYLYLKSAPEDTPSESISLPVAISPTLPPISSRSKPAGAERSLLAMLPVNLPTWWRILVKARYCLVYNGPETLHKPDPNSGDLIDRHPFLAVGDNANNYATVTLYIQHAVANISWSW